MASAIVPDACTVRTARCPCRSSFRTKIVAKMVNTLRLSGATTPAMKAARTSELLLAARVTKSPAGSMASLASDEREAILLAYRLPAFYASRPAAVRRPWALVRAAVLTTATILLVVGLGTVVLANIDLRKLPWLAQVAQRVNLGPTLSIASAPPAMTQEEALARAPFRAVRPEFVPSDFAPVAGFLVRADSGSTMLILRYAGPRGTIAIAEVPRSTGGIDTRMLVPENATTVIPIADTTAVFARGVWRLEGKETVWDPTSPGRFLFFASKALVFRIEWYRDSVRLDEATEIAAGLIRAGGGSP